MKLCGFVFVLMTCLLCATQKVNTFSDCQKRANSQHDLQACADHEFRRVDADMTQNYQQLLAKAQGDAVAKRKIRAAQQSWLSFRDAQLEAMYPHADKPGEYGSSYPTCALLLKTELTRQRAILLSRMLSPIEGEVCDAGLRYPAANLNENSPAPMVATPATYAGDFPCADCEGTRFTVTLRSDGIFISRRTYLCAALPARQPAYREHPWLTGSIWGFTAETSIHALRLMGSGLFDDYPKLKIILGHLGEGLPCNIWRIDNRIARTLQDRPKAKHPIGHYLRENFYITTSGSFRTQTLTEVMLEIGSDRILYPFDFPFEDMGIATEWFDHAAISEADRAKIGSGNAAQLFRI
jgi:uncharacterized protein YecT (DUF1311 family)